MDASNRTGQGSMATDTGQALAMLSAFASVGARTFDVTLLNSEGGEVNGGFQSNRSVEELRRSIGRRLEEAARSHHSIVIRPRSTEPGAATLIQLDDFNEAQAGRMEPHAFLTIRTSPGNFQVWLAVSDAPTGKEEAKQFKTRVRRGAGADHSATGATRIAGSLNFKAKYAPAFPRVEITQANAGRLTTVAALEHGGFIAPEQPLPPASVPPQNVRPGRNVTGQGTRPRSWPDYQRTLQGAPMKRDGTGPDRSTADFMWCKWAIQRGHGIEETAARLAEVSERAREAINRGDVERPGFEGYCKLTARKAATAMERERGQQRFQTKEDVHPW